MSENHFISQTERLLLLGLISTICLTFYFHLATVRIEEYNKNVRSEQIKKWYEATTPPDERFSFSHGSLLPSLIARLYLLQFFINPILLLILWKPKPLRMLVSLPLSLLMASSLSIWIYREYSLLLLNELYKYDSVEFGYFSVTSHITSAFLGILFVVLIAIQFFILIRFTIERFQAKISLR